MLSNQQKAAIAELKTVKSVQAWNDVRAKHLKILGTETKEQREFLHFYIDGWGLIIKVLGKDKPKDKQNNGDNRIPTVLSVIRGAEEEA
jgi:hypothetical protein